MRAGGAIVGGTGAGNKAAPAVFSSIDKPMVVP
jgi:hypothetical protein